MSITGEGQQSYSDATDPRSSLMQQIAGVLSMEGMPVDVAEFWYQTALAVQIASPSSAPLEAARQVMEALDETWDEDYRDDDGQSPSIEAYEVVYDRLMSRGTDDDVAASPPADVETDDDEDDGIGAISSSFTPQASASNPEIETILNRVSEGRLVLNPQWQRGFVWKLKKQRRLIESILLGLPIPSMLLFRDSTSGNTYVIDGRQRLETMSRFTAGKPDRGEERRRFKTFPATVEGWREGEKLHSAAGKYYDDLPPEFKAIFDQTTLVAHTFVDLPREKLYQIFRRYNTGAEQLRAAEIRNAVYQSSPLHEMMYRLGGEPGAAPFFSEEEQHASERLRFIMKRKVARYGAYDFIGRYFAFAYMLGGTVANATNDFMGTHAADDVNRLRDEFIRVLNVTCEWYEYPLTTLGHAPAFHAFLATVQMVSTRKMLEHVDAGSVTADAVKHIIDRDWPRFVDGVLGQKQNAKVFWQRQREWIEVLRTAVASGARAD